MLYLGSVVFFFFPYFDWYLKEEGEREEKEEREKERNSKTKKKNKKEYLNKVTKKGIWDVRCVAK